MDYYQNQNNEMNQNIPQIDPKYRGLSIASMVCGICSLVLCCTGLLSIPAGALGILFAMLTRKKGQRMSSMCVAGIWLSCVGLALGIFITISSIVTVFTDPSYRNMLDQMYQQGEFDDLQSALGSTGGNKTSSGAPKSSFTGVELAY